MEVHIVCAFVAARYEITAEDGRPVIAGFFRSADELLDAIRCQRQDTYRACRRFGRGLHLEEESELRGEVMPLGCSPFHSQYYITVRGGGG
jgi:hypothetical protein